MKFFYKIIAKIGMSDTNSTTNIIQLRKNGLLALGTCLKSEKNGKVFEKYIYNCAEIKSGEEKENIENIYRRFVYQVVGDITKGAPLKPLLSNVKALRLGWEHKDYEKVSQKISEHDEFIVNPFEVVEGVSKCPIENCGNERVFTYTKQCRSGDESSTTFNQCMKCNYTWTYSG